MKLNSLLSNVNFIGDLMENKQIPRREEKLWSEIKNYQVATNNARILGVLDELIINEKTGKIVDIAIIRDAVNLIEENHGVKIDFFKYGL